MMMLDQYDLVLYFNDRMEAVTDDYVKTERDYSNHKIYERLKRNNAIKLLQVHELFAFFVNNEKIIDTKIIEFFKDAIIGETELIFKTYPEIADNKTMVTELRKLLDSFKR